MATKKEVTATGKSTADLSLHEAAALSADLTLGNDKDGKPKTSDLESEHSKRRDVKVQTLGKQVVSTLYMLVRNVKIHAPDNQIFLKPIESLREAMNAVIATDR